MSVADFEKKYEKKSNTELYEIYINIEAYSEEGKQAINNVITKRGGIDKLISEYNRYSETQNEKAQLAKLISSKLEEGKTKTEIILSLKINYLEEQEINQIYSDLEEKHLTLEKNRKITFKSFLGGLIGTIVGGVVGGILWGMMMVGSGRIFWIFGIGLALICYFFVWLFSRKDKSNVATILFTAGAFLLAIYIGGTIYDIMGPREYLK